MSAAVHGRDERARLRKRYQQHARRRDAQGWFGLLGPPLAWLTAQLLAYALVPWVCHGGSKIVLHAVTLAAMAVAGAGTLCGWAASRDAGLDASDPRQPSARRRRFVGVLAALASLVFFFVLIGQEVANVLLDPCHA